MKTLLFVVSGLLLVGCGPYAGVQADLVAQGQEGLRRVEAARRVDSAAVMAFLVERREKLDDAFDRDVRGRANLDADWVIASRKAYAIGLDALADARARQGQASDAAADNAASADQALGLLQHMLRTQESFLKSLVPTTQKGE